MTIDNYRPDGPIPNSLPESESLLRETDWSSLRHALGCAEDMPEVLAELRGADPIIQGRALDQGLEPVRHQSSIYSATLPVALYIAAILKDPSTTSVGVYELHESYMRRQHPRPLRAALLDWLGALAHDADDENAEDVRQRGWTHPLMDVVRIQRPVFFQAVSAFLDDADPEVREAALVAAVPLVEDPELAHYRVELVPRARRVLTVSADKYYRARAVDGLTAWGHDVPDVPTSDDFFGQPEPDPWFGGYTESPPF